MTNNETIYMVVVKPDSNIFKDFKIWITNEHIYDMLCHEGFLSASIFNYNNDCICIKYRLLNQDHLKYYINSDSHKMRKKTDKKFLNKYSAKRFIVNHHGLINL
tara:strand:- start:234 stop:545 length:312 start_codon:yes stop_codon:yes gene_type:complete